MSSGLSTRLCRARSRARPRVSALHCEAGRRPMQQRPRSSLSSPRTRRAGESRLPSFQSCSDTAPSLIGRLAQSATAAMNVRASSHPRCCLMNPMLLSMAGAGVGTRAVPSGAAPKNGGEWCASRRDSVGQSETESSGSASVSAQHCLPFLGLSLGYARMFTGCTVAANAAHYRRTQLLNYREHRPRTQVRTGSARRF